MTEPHIPRQKDKSPILKNALHYLSLGWSVIPVRNKEPLILSWKGYQQKQATREEIQKWWIKWPNANIAVVTGAVSGVVVIDVDDAAGEHAIKSYIKESTLTATTRRGGKHYYFKHPGTEVPNAVRFLPGVDCRGDGGYVVAYRWDDPKTAIADIPPELLAKVKSSRHKKLKTEDWVTDIPDGERDKELTRRAGRLLQAGMPAAECLSIISVINATHCKPPLGAKQVQKIVQSIAGREAGKREAKSETSKFITSISTQREMRRQHGKDETRWTISDWLPEASCGLIVAPPGSYKTWILTALAYAVATGKPFLNYYSVINKGPVLFIQQEDPWWMLQSRLARMPGGQPPTESGKGNNKVYTLDCRSEQELDEMPLYWYTAREFNFANKDALAGMEQKIVELQPKLVMIDPLYAATDTKDYMAESAQKMLTLKIMRDKYNCSFVLAHHTTVSGAGSADRASIWGSQFLNAWLEWGWRVPEGDDKGNIIIRHFKGSEDPKHIRIKFNITDFSFDAEIDEKPAESIPERIEEMILNGGRFGTVRAVAEILECGPGAVHKAIKKMGLEKDEEGYYRMLPEEEKDE